jgi:hypothetical protein
MSLMAIYTGLQWLPAWLLQPYETLLLSSSPVIIMLEGLATMVIIITSGQGLADFLFDRSDVLKALLVLACIGIYGISSLTIFSIYQAGLIKALLDASLVAVSLTLIAVLSVATLMIEHGVLTDAALLFLYVTYNIWTITRSSITATTVTHEPRSLLGYLANMTWSTAPTQDSLLSMVRTLFQMFSLEMVTGLFIQMSVFLIVTRIIEQTSDNEDIKQERSFSLKVWLHAELCNVDSVGVGMAV